MNLAKHDDDVLLMALQGYETLVAQAQVKMFELRKVIRRRKIDPHRLIGGAVAIDTGASPPAKRKHLISPEGRARIAAAQRRRWREVKKTKMT